MTYFEWDPLKAESNIRKHGVSFEEAVDAFLDPSAISTLNRVVHGEQRWQTIGMVTGVLLLFIAHTVHTSEGEDEVVRVISARKALRKERRAYEERSED